MCQAVAFLQLHQTKISQQRAKWLCSGFIRPAQALQNDVARLHVAMDNAALVGVVQRLGDLDADLQALNEWQILLEALQAA